MMPIVATSFRPTIHRAAAIAAVVVIGLIPALLALPTALLALISGFGLTQLPYPLFLVLQKLPIVFPLHMITSSLALILIPIAAFARHRRRIHRAAGRATAGCVIVGSLTGMVVAVASEATLIARAGFFAQGLVWFALLVAAIAAIRCGHRALHVRLMIAMACVASGAVWLRLVAAGVVALKLPFDDVYAAAAWACWLVPLAIAATLTTSADLLARRRDNGVASAY